MKWKNCSVNQWKSYYIWFGAFCGVCKRKYLYLLQQQI